MTIGMPAPNPPWPRLAGLTLLVLAAHGWVLVAAPLRLSALKTRPDDAAKAFVTRTIAPPPVPEAVAPAPPPKPVPSPKPRPQPVIEPKIVPNEALAPVQRAQAAIDLVANEPSLALNDSALATTPSENVAPEVSLPLEITPLATITASAPVLEPPTATAAVSPATVTPPARLPAASAPAAAQPTVITAINLPGSANLAYKMTGTSKGLNYYANAELVWRNSGSDYEAGMRVSAFLLGSRSMSSVGRITPGGLAPTRFSDKSRSEVAAHFEADKGKVTFSANTPDVPWMDGAQDRVSVFLQLGGMLAAGPGGSTGSGNPDPSGTPAGFGVGSSITLYTVGPRDADTWTFLVEATETLSLPAGDMATLKLTRKPRREYDQKVEVWFAPSLGFLPVRNRITQANGDFVDQQLSSVSQP